MADAFRRFEHTSPREFGAKGAATCMGFEARCKVPSQIPTTSRQSARAHGSAAYTDTPYRARLPARGLIQRGSCIGLGTSDNHRRFALADNVNIRRCVQHLAHGFLQSRSYRYVALQHMRQPMRGPQQASSANIHQHAQQPAQGLKQFAQISPAARRIVSAPAPPPVS